MGLETGTYLDDLVNTNPLGADDRSTADDHLRLLKSVLLNTFPNLDNACNMTPTELNKLVGLTASTSELNIMDGVLASTSEINRLTSIAGDGALDAFPAGTEISFHQTTAPTGWTKETTHNNKAFRVTTGSVGSGGSSGFTTVFGLQATDSHTLSTAQMPSHNHGSEGAHTHLPRRQTTGPGPTQNISQDANNDSGEINMSVPTTSDGAHTHTSNGSGSGHSHNIELRVQYVDLILASKD